jgi:hypothetical protein
MDAVILLSTDQVAKKATPTNPKKDAKYMGSPSISKPQIIEIIRRKSMVYRIEVILFT